MAAGEGLTSCERWIVVAATLAAAISRLFALARTPWDWDELLFMQALDHYDVAAHRPHPPGFPLYILAAKIVRKLGFGDFHALQALSLIAAMAIVPAMFFLCRALGMRFATSLYAALVLAFLPNVWFYGGAAFSDVPAMVLVTVSLALLLRERVAAGSGMLAVAAGVRPQNLLIGAVPLLLNKRRALAGIAIVAVIAGISYGVAASLTGWESYREALRAHSAYITAVDSFRSPARPPLWRVFDDFFVFPYRAPAINAVVTALCAISVVVSLLRRRRHVLLALAAFGPFCLMALLFLDRHSASRFSIGYAPLMALLVADGMQLVARRFEPVAAAALLALMIVWTWPALAAVRHSVSPPVAAVDWLRNHADPRTATIYVDAGMAPYAEWYMPEYKLRYLRESAPPAAWALSQPGLYIREGASNTARAENFVRPRGRLWDIARQRYFEVSVRPVSERVEFGAGWYDEEGAGMRVWRWMAGRSVAELPPVAGDARLTLGFFVPLDALAAPPEVTIRVNGAVVDRFRPAASEVEREVIVTTRPGATNELVIETSGVVKPARDPRTLGLRLNLLGWMPVR